jgi:predicted nucleic acid-binding protein
LTALICDTSGLLAYFDASEAQNEAVSSIIDTDSGPFVVSPYVLAEVDYLLATRRGVPAELAALRELSSGAWELPGLESSDVRRAADIVDRYQDLAIGLADASLVALAHGYRTDRLLTLDRRHFQVVRTITGGPFTVLPMGAY